MTYGGATRLFQSSATKMLTRQPRVIVCFPLQRLDLPSGRLHILDKINVGWKGTGISVKYIGLLFGIDK